VQKDWRPPHEEAIWFFYNDKGKIQTNQSVLSRTTQGLQKGSKASEPPATKGKTHRTTNETATRGIYHDLTALGVKGG